MELKHITTTQLCRDLRYDVSPAYVKCSCLVTREINNSFLYRYEGEAFIFTALLKHCFQKLTVNWLIEF